MKSTRLAGFQASVKAQPAGETIELALSVPLDKLAAIASVDFQGDSRNGHPFRVAGGGKHDLVYSALMLDPSLLKKGTNQIVLLSDTELPSPF